MKNIPSSVTKRLRACMSCSLVKTQSQFKESGCENCGFLRMKDNLDHVLDCTSDRFTGLVAVMGRDSWVSRWQRIDGFVKGVYAVTVEGELPEECVSAMEREGRVYHQRDKAFSI